MGLGFGDVIAVLAMVLGGVYLLEMLGRLFVTWRIAVAGVKRIQDDECTRQTIKEAWSVTNGKSETKEDSNGAK